MRLVWRIRDNVEVCQFGLKGLIALFLTRKALVPSTGQAALFSAPLMVEIAKAYTASQRTQLHSS